MPQLTWDQTGDQIVWDSPIGLTWDGEAPNTTNHMSSDNRISAALAAADLATIKTKINEIRALLPFLISLPPAEREEMPKLGDKTLAFDEKCQTYMTNNPSLVPGFVTLTEVDKDRALRDALLEVLRELAPLLQAVTDTALLCGSETYMADLAFYQNVRQAARRGVTGTQAIFDDLRMRFPGASQPPPPTPPPPTP
jgi:hypothetical protein